MTDAAAMTPDPGSPSQAHSRPVSGLVRASLTLVAGGALAQALPLVLGPMLTRLYSPAEMGLYHVFAAVAANVGVVACARYEFALPMAVADREADALRILCLRVLAAVTLLSVVGSFAWWAAGGATWVLWLPLAVGSTGAVSLATMWAMREQRFSALAASRVWRYAGGALAQVGAGLVGGGVVGLMLAPIIATLVAAERLRMPWSWGSSRPYGPPALKEVARRYKDFPLLNTPHAFTGALQDTVALAVIATALGPAAAGFWGLANRYLKAPATLIGGAVSQALYPKLAATGAHPTRATRAAVRRVIFTLSALALPLVLALTVLAPWAFQKLFGAPWREAGVLSQALAMYIGLHFVAAPLAVVTMAWQAQKWALKLALVGQVAFVVALAAGLYWGGLAGAGWAESAVMTFYFGYYLLRLATWPVADEQPA